MKKIAIICVNYGSYAELSAYLESISLQHVDGVSLAVIVVDNTPPDTRRAVAQADEFSWVRCIVPPENLGYFGAAAFASDLVGEMIADADYVIVSNVDILISDPSFIFKLASLNLAEDVEALAPRIIGLQTAAELNPFLRVRPLAKKINFTRRFFRYYPISIAYQLAYAGKSLLLGFRKNRAIGEGVREIYAPHGSFIIFTRNFFRKGGSLRHPCFLYCEEIFVGEQIMRRGGHVRFSPELAVVHAEHASTGWIKSRVLARYQYEAICWASSIYSSKAS